MSRTLRVRVALGAGLTLLTVALGVVLSGSPLGVAGTNSVLAGAAAGTAAGGFSSCQAAGTLPRGTTAVRISASANTGPWVRVQVVSAGRVVTSGERGAGWGVTETVTVPLRPLPSPIDGAEICLRFGPVIEGIRLNGTPRPRTGSGTTARPPVLLRFEYLRPRRESWWSSALSIARRVGHERTPSGTWAFFLVLVLMIGVVALVLRAALRELR